MEAKDLIDLWKHENTIANQKTAYYFASIAFLTWPTIQSATTGSVGIARALSVLGVLFSLLLFFSISRTVAFRDRWKQQLKAGDKVIYDQVFGDISLSWYQRLPSNSVLIGLPLVGCAFWVFVLITLCVYF